MRKILIVDDELLMHVLYKKYFEREGFELFAAHDGIEALSVVERITPDLILMDVMMPGMDGISVIHELRKIEAVRDVPVIVVTANVGQYENVGKLARMRGVDGLLTKPLSPARLIAEVWRVLKPAAPPAVVQMRR
jgi:two-component system alkaline phosphatase synthesis response regulator PhoP